MNNDKMTTTRLMQLLREIGATSPNGPVRLVLEPRVVFDAAGVALAADAIDPVESGDASAESAGHDGAVSLSDNAHLADALFLAGDGEAARDVVFIDSGVNDVETLIEAVPAGAEYVLLSGERDGIGQIADYLEGRTGVGAIHILSHGDAGTLRIGNATLDLASIMGEHADALSIIKSSLADDADILIYGCDVAAGAAGQAFLDAFSEATGADVAASDDPTGAADLGGDWKLEVQSGAVEATALAATGWRDLLTDPPIIDLNSNASAGDTDVDFNVTFVEDFGPVAIAAASSSTFDANGDSVQTLSIVVGGLADGNDEVLVIAGQTLPLATSETIGNVTIPGTTTLVDIGYDFGIGPDRSPRG